ncbi:UDP-4-amino-4,6-dideoxy-N-acetyl-beta-L-altrosamine N-acetyltransferase [Yunchengibacter salinarum]|uniref:UDP-4-amino-4, 6-dideoxy-N-acetyl-beta-L-altrosamine N-acetyltransferase n=1 Tax=Yunchengibacter salinarum TaxID=3133399 RepID=UPI0035B6063A
MATPARIGLRPLEDRDRERLRTWRNSPDVAAFMYNDHPISSGEHARWFDAARTDERRFYRLILVGETPAGLFNFYDIDPAHKSAKWAFYLADPVARGAGVGTVIEHFALHYAFETLGLNRLSCEVLASNAPVVAMHQAFGFVQEGVLRQAIRKAGVLEDVVILAALRDDWPHIAKAAKERLAAKGLQPAHLLA